MCKRNTESERPPTGGGSQGVFFSGIVYADHKGFKSNLDSGPSLFDLQEGQEGQQPFATTITNFDLIENHKIPCHRDSQHQPSAYSVWSARLGGTDGDASRHELSVIATQPGYIPVLRVVTVKSAGKCYISRENC